MKYQKALAISVVAIAIVFLLQTQIFYIKFNEGLKVTDLTTLLMSFSIIAMLIERLLDKGPLEPGYGLFKKERSDKATFANNTDDATALKEYKKTFNWSAFVIGVVMASLGFKFFINITEPVCPNFADCKSEEAIKSFQFFKTNIYPIVDILLTGILLSNGSQFIREIIIQLRKFLNIPDNQGIVLNEEKGDITSIPPSSGL